MAIIDAVVNFRRWLKRRNCSPHTVRNYMNTLRHFVLWLAVPIEAADSRTVAEFIDRLIGKRLHPKTSTATWTVCAASTATSSTRNR